MIVDKLTENVFVGCVCADGVVDVVVKITNGDSIAVDGSITLTPGSDTDIGGAIDALGMRWDSSEDRYIATNTRCVQCVSVANGTASVDNVHMDRCGRVTAGVSARMIACGGRRGEKDVVVGAARELQQAVAFLFSTLSSGNQLISYYAEPLGGESYRFCRMEQTCVSISAVGVVGKAVSVHTSSGSPPETTISCSGQLAIPMERAMPNPKTFIESKVGSILINNTSARVIVNKAEIVAAGRRTLLAKLSIDKRGMMAAYRSVCKVASLRAFVDEVTIRLSEVIKKNIIY